MITERLPCDKEEAIELLEDVEGWLAARIKLTVIVGAIALAMSVSFSLIGPLELEVLGITSTILLAILIVWLYRGNKSLEGKVIDFKTALEKGVIDLDNYCDLPVVTAVVAYHLKRAGKYEAGAGKGRWEGPGKG